MSATIIDGKQRAAAMRGVVAEAAGRFRTAAGRAPGLAVVLVGEDPASQVYVRSKRRQTVETGMESFAFTLAASTPQAELLALIERLNADESVDGILVQLPLPAQIDEGAVLAAIDPAKDVDGFHAVNAGRLMAGRPALVPCTPLGCSILVRETLGDLSGKHAVVVGRSNIVGKPVAMLMLHQDCTVTIAHSRTVDLPGLCRTADILIAAAGRPGMIGGDWIKPGATVIDVGINRLPDGAGGSRLVGDVDFQSAAAVAGAITPVPGGVGPMTIACLLRNTVQAACMRAGLRFDKIMG